MEDDEGPAPYTEDAWADAGAGSGDAGGEEAEELVVIRRKSALSAGPHDAAAPPPGPKKRSRRGDGEGAAPEAGGAPGPRKQKNKRGKAEGGGEQQHHPKRPGAAEGREEDEAALDPAVREKAKKYRRGPEVRGERAPAAEGGPGGGWGGEDAGAQPWTPFPLLPRRSLLPSSHGPLSHAQAHTPPIFSKAGTPWLYACLL